METIIQNITNKYLSDINIISFLFVRLYSRSLTLSPEGAIASSLHFVQCCVDVVQLDIFKTWMLKESVLFI